VGRIGTIIYLVIGVIVAANKGYLGGISSIGDFINLVLAILLWPLLFFGVHFNIKVGGKDNGKKHGLLIAPALIYGRAAVSSAWDKRPRRQAA
jgi:hypothetical protein